MEKITIAICEQDDRIYQKFGKIIIDQQWQLFRINNQQSDIYEHIKAHAPDLIIFSDPLERTGALDLLTFLKEHHIHTPVIFVAQTASIRTAMDAVHQGASDYLLLTDDKQILERSICNILKQNKLDPNNSCEKGNSFTFITNDTAMLNTLDMAKRIAPSDATVLIQGESGTGKEVLARYIHSHSGRADYAFVAMNCAALPDSLAESELFGYEKGAFTGAGQRRSGKFELADNGTLLLDEIGEMPLLLQAKLLRVLQEKEVDRVGGQKAIPVNTRVIATTNRDLARMVQEGNFRKDLYYRLRIIPLTLPPLHSRRQDIAFLTDHFIKKHAPKNEPLPRFNAEAIQRMQQWQWPGNVRELENTVERALLIRSGLVMGPELLLLDEEINNGPTQEQAELVGLTVKELEERLIVQTLKHVNENRTHAAEMLGISIRTLRNKLREYREGGEDPARMAEVG